MYDILEKENYGDSKKISGFQGLREKGCTTWQSTEVFRTVKILSMLLNDECMHTCQYDEYMSVTNTCQ